MRPLRWVRFGQVLYGYGSDEADATGFGPAGINLVGVIITIQYGYAGNDTLRGIETLTNQLYGGSGHDFLDINFGSGSVYGGDGNDRIHGFFPATVFGVAAVATPLTAITEMIVFGESPVSTCLEGMMEMIGLKVVKIGTPSGVVSEAIPSTAEKVQISWMATPRTIACLEGRPEIDYMEMLGMTFCLHRALSRRRTGLGSQRKSTQKTPCMEGKARMSFSAAVVE